MNKWLGLSIAVAPSILGSLWMFYMFLIFLPRQEREAEEEVQRFNNDPNRRGPKRFVEWR